MDEALTWNDWTLNAQGSAIFGEFYELLDIIKELSNNDLGSSIHLHKN